MRCKGKKAKFATIKEASQVMTRMNEKRAKSKRRRKRVLRMYFCPYCEAYHLTSWSAKKTQKVYDKIYKRKKK